MIEKLLGRYEYRDYKSNKYWTISRIAAHTGSSKDVYLATYGRIGSKGTSTEYPEEIALKKINEKISKGYVKVGKPTVWETESTPKAKTKKEAAVKSALDWVSKLPGVTAEDIKSLKKRRGA